MEEFRYIGVDNNVFSKLELSTRTQNTFRNFGITSFGTLLSFSHRELKSMPNFGAKCFSEVCAVLEDNGFPFYRQHKTREFLRFLATVRNQYASAGNFDDDFIKACKVSYKEVIQ
jgi:hypothetical protein